MRKKIIAGNWKMNKTVAEAEALAESIKRELSNDTKVDVVLCPPATAISAVSQVVSGSQLAVGAQNMHWEAEGAFTGELSAGMLRDLYCRYVILGHSERRQYFAETDASVNKKTHAALAAGLKPIVCVGETLEEREADQIESVITTQVNGGLKDLTPSQLKNVIIAYEPVWAIGTGKTATPEQAQDVHALIRGLLAKISDQATADAVRIQYGGSMKPANAAELLSKPDIDGGLIGGAALDAPSFIEIVKAAANA
ncbi:MAG: triose-phosphate isomerase [Verrucomicrobia bacterium]|nr:triose-phosphate isomerase [Verrucomicrobiota bacterium]MCH8512304.1 triose-phosphate isomerase [Kiritimatiellia bacterium]